MVLVPAQSYNKIIALLIVKLIEIRYGLILLVNSSLISQSEIVIRKHGFIEAKTIENIDIVL